MSARVDFEDMLTDHETRVRDLQRRLDALPTTGTKEQLLAIVDELCDLANEGVALSAAERASRSPPGQRN